jgi:hypothetical protein
MSVTKVRYNQMAPIPEPDDTAVDLSNAQVIDGEKTFKKPINLYPNTTTANTGGQINFHYNQSSNATSSIVENASGQIRVNGDLDLNGKIMNNPLKKEIPLTRGVISSGGGAYTLIGHTDNSNNNIARILNDYGYTNSTTFRNTIGFYLYNPTDTSTGSVSSLGITYNQDGILTFAPTPATTDNSTQIATTAYVKSNLSNYAIVNSPTFTGEPKSTTPASTDNSTRIATTAFVNNRLPYTTGTWTPALTGRNTKGALTYSIQTGTYYKIGHLVYIFGRVKVSGVTTQPVGNVGIEGFPFSSNGLFVSINFQGYGGASNSFRKATVGYWDGAKSMMCIHGNSATSMGMVDHLMFSTSSVADRYIQFNSTNTSADGLGHFLFSGWYSTNA